MENRWIPKRVDPVTGLWGPSVKQAEFLCRPELEGMYGGAAGGGKSWALLAAAARFVDVPGYHAILFRRHLTDHKLSGGLIAKALEWWGNSKARWNAVDFKFTFPSSADVQFGFLEAESDRQRYASTAFHFEGFDESTQFPEDDYVFMLSRMRRDSDCKIPLQVRCATNPGDVGHEWNKRRFIVDGAANGRFFIPATLDDNNFIDKASYDRNLGLLSHVQRARLRFGDWDICAEGNMFKYEWFLSDKRSQFVDAVPEGLRQIRFWDLAGSEVKKGTDPDYTAGVKGGRTVDGRIFISDVQHFRKSPLETENKVREIALGDGVGVKQYSYQDPAQAGKSQINYYAREVLRGLPFTGVRITGDKVSLANPLSAACENGFLYLVKGGWNMEFINELCQFPVGSHNDQVDASSGMFNQLCSPKAFIVW